jgi:Phosphotransferase enzyme family
MTHLPILVETFFNNNDVNITSIDGLSGVNPGRGMFSYRVNSKNKSYILKNCTEKREYDVYTKHASFFKNNNINIPEVYFSCEEDRKHWIIIEDLPHPFAKNRWKADSEQIYMLYKLHSKSLNSEIEIKEPYQFNWDEKLTEKVQCLLPNELTTKIYYLREQAKDLFTPFCCISGDPNPTNWGVRDNGELVLFDFERIGYGNPAIDLAITMPGFGSEDGALEYEIAKKYISHWKSNTITYPFSVNELTKQIQLAKVWSALDYLANNHKTMNQQNLVSFLQQLMNRLKVHS